jgi:biotin transporter BioY
VNALPRSRLLAAALTGLRQAAGRPRILALLLLINLLTAWVLAAPLAGLLSERLDDNLYGNAMATGSSWRWFDEVERQQGEAPGDLSAWHGLFSHQGVALDQLRQLSGPALAVALAAFFLFWVQALAHSGFLATLYPDSRGGFGAATARFAFPTTVMATGAAFGYLVSYLVCYRLTGFWLAGWMERVDQEWMVMAATMARLMLTLAAWLAVKLFYDLSRVVLVDRDSGNWPWANLLALRHLARQGWRYAALYLLLGALAPLLVLLWGWTAGRIAPQGWFGLGALFVLQQLFLTARIGLRLSHLAAARALYRGTRQAPVRAPFKVRRRGEAPPDGALPET